MAAIGRQWWERFTVQDELTGAEFEWGEHDFVRLNPYEEPAHVFHVRS